MTTFSHISLSYADSAISLLPPIIAIVLAITTRKVLLSLGVGIIVGALLITDLSLMGSVHYIGELSVGLFWDDGALNSWNLYLLGFLLLLGMVTALITVSGATSAFAEWAKTKIRNKRGAKLLTMLLGCIVFIDDYFNSLVVGSVARPLTDRYYISRSKLAYLLDSTAAPICVISPISSWGAYIIALIGGILTTHGMTDMGHLYAFVQMIPMNFYAIFALLLLFCVAVMELNIGPMREHELNAQKGILFDDSKGLPPGANAPLDEAEDGRVKGLFRPIIALVGATVFFMINSGANTLAADGKAFSLLGAFENTDVASSLFFGAAVGLVTTLFMVIRQGVPLKMILNGLRIGAKSMLPAIYILLFAWTIAAVIGQLETGRYMASLASGNIPYELLPVVLFMLAGFTAFSTGTSWGTFGIMLPIAADMAVGTDSSMMLPMLSSVLAGAVFGDHCSPISDTTILSSTGANCHHIDHVITQLPYAVIVAVISIAGYTVMGYSGSLMMGLLAASILFVIAVLILKKRACQGIR